jgi:Fe-S cluster assembly iron-binding protein IscA
MDKTHLNKIVEYLLEDIKINYLHSTVEILDGSNRTYDVEFLSNGFFSTVWDILEFDYGLNSDDCLYVYGNLLFQINRKIKLPGSINESVDNKEIYLDKIVQYIIDDTEIDYNKNLCKLPYLYNPIPIIPPFIIPSPYYYSFLKYCKDIYGLTGEEIIYVWEKYKSIVDDKGSINESVERKEKYLDNISQYIIDDTELDYEQKLVTYPFLPYINSQWGLSTPLYYATIESPLFNAFSEYCNDTYGLTYEESVYVWDQYKVIFNHKINSKPMNESVDSKKIYLDKIVQYIIDDTIIDYEEREIKYPYFSNILLLTPNKQQHLPVHSFRAFSIYCENMYGLHIEEIQYVWHHYIKNSGLF